MNFRFLFLSATLLSFPLYASGNASQVLDQQINNQNSQDRSRQQQVQLETKDALSKTRERDNNILVFDDEKDCFDMKQVILLSEPKLPSMRPLETYANQVVGICLGINGVETLAKGLQDKIIRSGYVTTRVTIPEQNISNGTLTLQIIPGKVSNVQLAKDSDSYITLGAIMPAKEGDLLNIRDIEQGLENLERIPGAKANIELRPGKEFSTTDIVIQREKSPHINVGGYYNNSGSRQTGKDQVGVTVYGNNLTSLNDTLYVSAGKNLKNQARNSTSNAAIYYAVPYNYWLYSLYASKSEYKQTINDTMASYKYYGDSKYFNATASNVFLRGQTFKDTASLQLIKRKSKYKLEDVSLLSQQRDLTSIKLGVNHRQNIDNATVDASIYYQRNVPWFGAEESWDMRYGDVSTMGRVLSADISGMIPIVFDDFIMSYNPQLFVQYSPDRLTIQDQFSLGNRWTVRGFDEEFSLIGDKGFYLRNEFNFYVPGFSFYPYYAIDYGRILGGVYPLGLYSDDQLLGTALGVRGNIKIFSYDLFLGVPLYKPDEYETNSVNAGLNVQWFW
ncbi:MULTISPECIES: ShlB/FhaC/HecB family hemolysin secretion/activation protein [Providencia]|nr:MULTISPECIES: ShlB/FhaC/HecB family hemolysin secretion/activation protein [Providencia]APC12019.1 Hemolysin transporter protein ShlB precursor [Providencia rettgeri]AVL75329.1 ShlB/FhaC/HecB family hemolysin secretion/activation protein [Providencia rettgeri]EJD6041265.1 ShlB/FhaC/HecB family hemolysin secretion/activation protein [Providencia rettgeri]EJD6506015.1 ShlB/FhaC/HecB family hemolysin secretion/activation protein [Providencia rettgeri]EJD6537588.1 ShlB/FhaC/HecB family hemolysi